MIHHFDSKVDVWDVALLFHIPWWGQQYYEKSSSIFERFVFFFFSQQYKIRVIILLRKRTQSKYNIARSASNVEGTHRYCHSGEYRTGQTGEIDSLQYSRVSKRLFLKYCIFPFSRPVEASISIPTVINMLYNIRCNQTNKQQLHNCKLWLVMYYNSLFR